MPKFMSVRTKTSNITIQVLKKYNFTFCSCPVNLRSLKFLRKLFDIGFRQYTLILALNCRCRVIKEIKGWYIFKLAMLRRAQDVFLLIIMCILKDYYTLSKCTLFKSIGIEQFCPQCYKDVR